MLIILDQYRHMREPAKYFPLREVEVSDFDASIPIGTIALQDVVILIGWERKEFLVMKHRWDHDGTHQGQIKLLEELPAYTHDILTTITDWILLQEHYHANK